MRSSKPAHLPPRGKHPSETEMNRFIFYNFIFFIKILLHLFLYIL
ncbi:hypothetical protein KR50_01550 [Jeotgalibacillus campisalis]|uniref:Uncharacterized protein n=1 Tax=Jeotgalibacillus campisalis TaxID=220754 RepID=A0A0C2W8A8_9BACL|nr:hypothetical protein KR50_01550 [Jeotgalibacillus campisalis]